MVSFAQIQSHVCIYVHTLSQVYLHIYLTGLLEEIFHFMLDAYLVNERHGQFISINTYVTTKIG